MALLQGSWRWVRCKPVEGGGESTLGMGAVEKSNSEELKRFCCMWQFPQSLSANLSASDFQFSINHLRALKKSTKYQN